MEGEAERVGALVCSLFSSYHPMFLFLRLRRGREFKTLLLPFCQQQKLIHYARRENPSALWVRLIALLLASSFALTEGNSHPMQVHILSDSLPFCSCKPGDTQLLTKPQTEDMVWFLMLWDRILTWWQLTYLLSEKQRIWPHWHKEEQGLSSAASCPILRLELTWPYKQSKSKQKEGNLGSCWQPSYPPWSVLRLAKQWVNDDFVTSKMASVTEIECKWRRNKRPLGNETDFLISRGLF